MKLPPMHFAPGEVIQIQTLLSTLNPHYQPHILSCGAGMDSLALLIEYIENPDSRDFPLENLVVIHAVVGGESVETKRLMETVIFPLCRQHHIWFIQAYRNGEWQEDGITILSSTRQPTTFYLRGDYSLFTYLIMSGTVPQRGGSSRLCTLKFKGWVIDALAIYLFGDSPRQRYLGFNGNEAKRAKAESRQPADGAKLPSYLIGYNSDERSRLKDKSFGETQPYAYELGFNQDELGRIKESTDRQQIFRFPLIEMGHGRQWCEQRVNDFATRWSNGSLTQGRKSFCVNGCPFSECTGKKRQRGNNTHGDLREDWLNEPQYGGEAAFIEHMALAINVHQPLYTQQLVIDILKESQNEVAIAHYERLLAGDIWVDLVVPKLQRLHAPAASMQAERLLAGKTWAVYGVRRMFTVSAKMPYRQTRILMQGSAIAAQQYLVALAERYGQTPTLEQLSYRFWTLARPVATGKQKPPRPYVEEFFVAAPATVYDKQRVTAANFDLQWLAITGQRPHIQGVDPDEPLFSLPNTRVKQSRIRGTRR